ncbi:MAG TPA: HAMP domain-containing sensor histidine kinase [Solirubrobacteraceae bacterium]|nr:HAMP domain-containing sensor histidine kinase [Solirubrobacteraceae bacterium]
MSGVRARLSSALPAGLRWRLTAWVAGVMVVSAAVVFLVVYQDTGAQLKSEIDQDISGDTIQLLQSVNTLSGESPARIASAAARYIRAQPYDATSTLLFVLTPVEHVSNHPELFGGGPPEDETQAEQQVENAEGRKLLVPHVGYSTAQVPDVGRTRIFEKRAEVGNVQIVAGAGEPLALVDRAQNGVARAFVLAGAVVLLLALVASYLAGARVSAPLRRMSQVATRVDAGDLDPRMDIPGSRRDEVRVLADAFNRMLDRLSEAFASQREFVADASHELRTPLTVIRGQLEVLAAQENPSAEEVMRVERLVQSEITRVSRLVDDLLVLAQAERTDFLRAETIDVRPFVTELWDGMSLTADRKFELGTITDGSLQADPDRLAQALRNLARNAIEHTDEHDGLVRLDVTQPGADRIRFAVLDDGPGIPRDERERVFERFHRTDGGRSRSSAGGAGLGLAIVRAIAEAHRGTVRVRDSQNGRGAEIELVLPGFEAS